MSGISWRKHLCEYFFREEALGSTLGVEIRRSTKSKSSGMQAMAASQWNATASQQRPTIHPRLDNLVLKENTQQNFGSVGWRMRMKLEMRMRMKVKMKSCGGCYRYGRSKR